MRISGTVASMAGLLLAGNVLALEPVDPECFRPALEMTCTTHVGLDAQRTCACSQMTIISSCDKKFYSAADPTLTSVINDMSIMGCFSTGAEAQATNTAAAGATTGTNAGSGGPAPTGTQKSAGAGTVPGGGREVAWVALGVVLCNVRVGCIRYAKPLENTERQRL
ncbi:hypothetical protein B0T16DRAFT_514329 [Cercophora newfieldiana]|uniref:Extracellular membrane protein CFEM domain-containing protein n=1 Tax=Cercophora newfieldiana TaxID=92897 RepID=A0AA40CPB8_9PEZI|nr:hypothetical protein B0T16DRAFT_514329 [Cercophora newfieldiana]